MDMTALLVKAGAIGVLIGSAFTALGFLYKNRLTALSAKKSCLYQLLELERSMLVAQVIQDKSQIDLYLEVLNEEVPGAIPPEQHEEAKSISKKLVDSSFGAMVQEDHNDLSSRFLDAIQKLSSIEPLMAERINSNLKVKAVLPAFDKYYENLKVMASGEISEEEVRAFEEVMSNYKYKLMDQAIVSLRPDILHVAFHSDILAYATLLRRKPKNVKDNISTHQREQMRTLVKELIAARKKHMGEA